MDLRHQLKDRCEAFAVLGLERFLKCASSEFVPKYRCTIVFGMNLIILLIITLPGLVGTIAALGSYQGSQIENKSSKVVLEFVISDPSDSVLGNGMYFLSIFCGDVHELEI